MKYNLSGLKTHQKYIKRVLEKSDFLGRKVVVDNIQIAKYSKEELPVNIDLDKEMSTDESSKVIRSEKKVEVLERSLDWKNPDDNKEHYSVALYKFPPDTQVNMNQTDKTIEVFQVTP